MPYIFFFIMILSIFSAGILHSEGTPPQREQPHSVATTDIKEKLIAYLLQHTEIPNQQELLKQVLETSGGTENVLRSLPEKDQKAIRSPS